MADSRWRVRIRTQKRNWLFMKKEMQRLFCLLAVTAPLLAWDSWQTGGSFSGAVADRRSQFAAPGSPMNLDQLLASASSQIGQRDIALLNLLSAEGLPGAEHLSPQDCIATLNGWADRVGSETERHLYRYRANPREFESSEGYFRMLMMAVVLYEDFSVRYNPERMSAPGAVDPNDHFFADSRDVFLHGMLGGQSSSPSSGPAPEPGRDAFHRVPFFSGAVTDAVERVPTTFMGVTALRPALNPQLSTLNLPRGTCSSLPVLYVAIGRRLGYPLKLATTKSHLFIRWEGVGERFDLEATGRGMNRYDDEHFKQWPYPVTQEEIQADGYLKSLTPVEELALFLSLRGHCLKEAGRMSEAVASYADAVRLAPAARPYRLLLAAAQQERAYPDSGVVVPPASAAGVPPAMGLPSTYAQTQPPPVPALLVPGSPPPTDLGSAAGRSADAFPQSPGPGPVPPGQPPDPNPLLKIRQQ
jgi:hypothetical protein